MNTQTNEVDAITANNNPTATETTPSESTSEPVKDKTERLAELATKIRDAYAKEHEADGIVVDWQAKQLKAGIEMGECLLQAKSLKPVGGFIKWCTGSFPDLCQRTLNRYMKIAREKDSTRVSQAKGLRDAYEKCSSSDRQGGADGKSDFQRDALTIKRHLSKATNLLSPYPDPDPCEEGDAICDLVDALNHWVTEYRERAKGQTLAKHRDAGVEVSLGDETQPDVSEANAEYVTAE